MASNRPGARIGAHGGTSGTQKVSKLHSPPIGIDGEGENGNYTLLACSTGEYIAKRSGLSTGACLEFIIGLPKDRLVWGFAFSYDVNMILRDLSLSELRRLAATTHVYFDKWRIEHIPGKKFLVTNRETRQSCTIWDMYPWRGSSFVSMLDDWGLCTEEELARIASMKDQRNVFSTLSDKKIREYCLEECHLLAKAVTRLQACIKSSGYTVTQFHSPGSLASAAMKAHNVELYRAPYPQELEDVLTEAYAGGRSESRVVGPVNSPIWEADIHSAYPFFMAGLPCFAHGTWRKGDHHKQWSLLRLKWRTKAGAIWGPYPMRGNVGSLRYPTAGEGWYWKTEALAGRGLCKEWAVTDSWSFVPECDHKPFSYLAAMYDKRRALVEVGDANELSYKLIMNSSYGKTGERQANRRRVPRWRYLPWAGLTTSLTRAMILDCLVKYGDSVVLTATDCIVTTEPLTSGGLPNGIGDGLGQWEVKAYDNLFVVGPGFYYAGAAEHPKIRSRGVTKIHVSFDEILAEWERAGRDGVITIPIRRFVGYKTALKRKDTAGLWRQFIDIPLQKTFSLYPRRMWNSSNVFDGSSHAPTLGLHNKTVIDDNNTQWRGALMAEFGQDLAAKLVAETRFSFNSFPDYEQPDWMLDDH